MTDYTLADTIYLMFTTRAFATGVPTTLAGTPVVSAYENDSATQITAGITLGVDHDTVTGLNLLTIVATGANGYEAGKDYNMVITTGTVSSVSVVGEVVGTFSLQRSAAAVDLANGTDGLGAIKAETAAILTDTAEIGTAGAGLTAILDQIANISISGAGLNAVAESYTLTTGTQSGGTYTNTQVLDSTSHQHTDDAGAMELYYQADIGVDGIPNGIQVVHALTGVNDDLTIYAYNWVLTQWDEIGALAGTTGGGLITDNFNLLVTHVGTGSDAGKVRIRYYAASGLTTATLFVDQLLFQYVQSAVGISNGSTITLTAATVNKNLIGRSWSLALAGFEISGTYIFQCIDISGTGTAVNGSPFIIQESNLQTVTLSAFGFIYSTTLSDVLTLTSTAGVTADSINILGCYSGVAGAGAPTLDASGVTKTTNIQTRGWLGGLTGSMTSDCVWSHEVIRGGTQTFTNAGGSLELRGSPKAVVLTTSGSGTSNIIVWSGCPITINGTGGTVNITGVHGGITDNSSGTTVTDSGQNIMSLGDVLIDTNELQADWVEGGRLDLIQDIIAADVVNIDGAAMRGTDNAALATALATAQSDLDIITGATGVNLLAATQASIDAIEADTNELQADWTNAGRLDAILDELTVQGDTNETAIGTRMPTTHIAATAGKVDGVALVDTTTTNTDMRGTDSAATAANLATAQSDLDIITGATGVNLLAATQASIDAIEADTNELQGDDVPGLIAALNNVAVADILTTQMTEAYAADGAAPTLTEALMMIQQMLGDFAISGTTLTVKQVDGATTAATFTLDDGTNPTSLTRTT